MISPRSLSFRLLAGAVVWIALALVVAGFVLSRMFEAQLAEQFARRMEATVNQIAASLEIARDGRLDLDRSLANPRFRIPYSGLYWQVEAAKGDVLLRSRSLWDGSLDLPKDTLLDGETHRHNLTGPDGEPVVVYERAVSLPGYEPRLRLAAAENASALQKAVGGFERRLALALGLLGLGLALAAAAQVVGGLRPLVRLRRALADIRNGRARRLENSYPDEIQSLVANLNAVLDRNEEVVARARTQAGNLAHSLKTPLAVLTNEAAALERSGLPEAAGRIAQQAQLMRRQVDYHLARARAAGSVRVPGVRTALADSLDPLLGAMRQIYRERRLTIEAHAVSAPAFRGERQDLDEILGNLLDNACKWARGRVKVEAQTGRNGALLVQVDDDGPGLSEDQRAAVFDRGRRLDETIAGSGLGLAIVRDLAELYGGGITLGESPLGGLRVTLELPASE